MLHFLRYQTPAIALAALIFTVSSFPSPESSLWEIRFADKWVHLLVYGGLGFLTARALLHQGRLPSWRERFVVTAIVVCTLYGVLDELHQAFVPGRFSDPVDALADAIGAVAGSLLYGKTRRE